MEGIDMRNTKKENLKRVSKGITLPKSYVDYIEGLDVTSSFSGGLQVAIAEKIMGISLEEYTTAFGQLVYDKNKLYHTHMFVGYVTEPIDKAFIRTARWMLESEISAGYLIEGTLTLEVYWKLTGVTTGVQVNVENPNNSFRLLYDGVTDMDSFISENMDLIDYYEDLGDLVTIACTLRHRGGLKSRLLSRWIELSEV